MSHRAATLDLAGANGPTLVGPIALLDEQRVLLTAARLMAHVGTVLEVAVDRYGSGRLLAHLYGKSRRRVYVETDEVRLLGRLFTRWDGRRRWLIELGPSPR